MIYKNTVYSCAKHKIAMEKISSLEKATAEWLIFSQLIGG